MSDPQFDGVPPRRTCPAEDKPLASARDLAVELSTGPVDASALRHAHESFDRMPGAVRSAFEEAFLENVATDPDRRQMWTEALREAIAKRTANVDALVDPFLNARRREELRAEALHWLRINDPFFMWEARRRLQDGPIVVVSYELHVLLQLDARAWLEELDALPWSSMMWNSVWLSPIQDDPELLEELVCCAPLMFDAQGQWTRSAALLLVMDAILTCAKRLHLHTLEIHETPHEPAVRGAVEPIPTTLGPQRLLAWLHAEYSARSGEIDPDSLVIATEREDLVNRLPLLPGPWGQRIPWTPADGLFPPLRESFSTHASDFDLFHRADPVYGRAFVGRVDEIEHVAARLLRGDGVGVLGLSKVGKSSLLRAVAERIDPVGARRALVHVISIPETAVQDRALVIALDVQHIAGRGLDKLIEVLTRELRTRLLALAPQPMLPGPSERANQ